MIEPFLTQEMLARIASMPRLRRAQAMKLVAAEEWNRCKEDIFYWLDASRHLVPYVYTKDPHSMYTCLHCTDGVAYLGKKRQFHLLNRHKIEASDLKDIKPNFEELPAIKKFPAALPYVRPIIETFMLEEMVAVEKSRDVLMTWISVAYFTWEVLFHEGRQVIFQSETATKTRELIDRAGVIFKNQPKWLQDVNKATISEGSNRAGLFKVDSLQSEIIGFPQGADQIRQFHPSAVFSDEAAFNPEASESFAAIKPAIMNGGKYVAISSANPSWFFRICRDAE